MAEEKKYTAREAAIAVLAKAQEVLGKSELVKSEKSKHDRCVEHVKQNSPEVKNPHAVCVAEGVKPAKWSKAEKAGENEIGTKFIKAENQEKPSNPMDPRIKEKATERDYQDFETKPGHAKENDHRQEEQKAPQDNPAEQKENNNPPSGAIPGNGVHKLFHFCGHVSAKKKMKKGIALS